MFAGYMFFALQKLAMLIKVAPSLAALIFCKYEGHARGNVSLHSKACCTYLMEVSPGVAGIKKGNFCSIMQP